MKSFTQVNIFTKNLQVCKKSSNFAAKMRKYVNC